jgi:hypothetical protein
MNLNRILINESEKKRILGLHYGKKSLGLISEGFNPLDQIYPLDTQQSTQVTYDSTVVYPKTIAKGTQIFKTNKYDKLYLGNTGFVMYCNRELFVYNDGIDNVRIGTGDIRNNSLRKILGDIYCNGNKLKTWDELWKDSNKKTPGVDNQKPVGNKPITNNPNIKENEICRLPGDKVWIYSKKGDIWYTSKNGGKTWIKLDPIKFKSAIDLLNSKAVCGGNQPSGDCKEKCSKQPKVRTPSDEIQYQLQYQGYFYDSIKGKCIEVTGESGPFGSIAECEACKCNGQDNVGDGNQKPGAIGILPTTDKLLECATKHLKITQLPISCTSTASNIMPTDPTQCFNDLLKGIDQQIVIDFIICLFGDKEIPKIIRELPLPGINIPIGELPGLKELPDFIPPTIIKPKNPFD